MKILNKPNYQAKFVFEECIKNIKNGEEKNFLKEQICKVEKSAKNFDELAEKTEYYKFEKDNGIDLKKQKVIEHVYSNGLVRSVNGRIIYDDILNSVPNEKCPICDIGLVKTLDHYLPKSVYCLLSVAPNNLVPMCSDCNKNKSNKYPTKYSDQLLHPYFDEFPKNPVLFADVIKNEIGDYIPKVSFYIKCSDKLTEERIQFHFNTYDLSRLYSSNAGNEISEKSYQFNKLRNIGEEVLKKYLKELYDSFYSTNINLWKTALYRALYESKWFSK